MKFYQALGISFEQSTIEYCLHDLAKKQKKKKKKKTICKTIKCFAYTFQIDFTCQKRREKVQLK
jgi:hypothetical protein